MTWDEIMQALADTIAINVVDEYQYGNDVYTEDDIQMLIENELSRMVEDIEFTMSTHYTAIEGKIREKLGVSE